MRRVTVAAVTLALLAAACGLGDKQAHADRIIAAGEKLMAAESLAATIDARVHVLPVERQLVAVDVPRIAEGNLTGLAAVLRPRAETASVAGGVLFVGSTMYERIAPKVARVGPSELAIPTNFNAIFAALHGAQLTAPVASTPPSTTSTTGARLLRPRLQIVREWAAFDFADIPDDEATKHGGSLAVNPVAVLRLVTGVLTGSIERRGDGVFHANVSRDKAERELSEQERDVLDKMFTANAISRRVFPAKFRFAPDGRNLVGFEVVLRQHLSSTDRADLTLRLTIAAGGADVAIQRPPRRGTVTVGSLGQLVTTVSGL